MFVSSPMRIGITSPRKVVWYQIEQFFPMRTSPMISALGATKVPLPICGLLPFNSCITLYDLSIQINILSRIPLLRAEWHTGDFLIDHAAAAHVLARGEKLHFGLHAKRNGEISARF